MNPAWRWALGLLGLLLLLVAPYLWKIDANYLWLVCPLLACWAFWLMIEYLRWAKSLGRK